MTVLQRYPAYRDSEVDWLGEVPEHWDMRRVGTVADLRVSNVDKHVKEGEQPVRLCNYVDVCAQRCESAPMSRSWSVPLGGVRYGGSDCRRRRAR